MKHIIFEITIPNASEQVGHLSSFLEKHRIQFTEKSASVATDNEIINLKSLGNKGLLVLNYLSRGFTYEEIAAKLEITIDGVRYYIKKIYKVLGVSNSAEAVRYYVKYLE